MTWNEIVGAVRDKLRRGFGRDQGQAIEVAREARLEQLGDTPLIAPAVDVYESDAEILIHADVPGASRETTTVAWDETRGLCFLVKSARPLAGSRWATEYEPRDFYRALDLPEYADGARASSTLKDGVLTIRVPKRTATTSKLIPVHAG